MQPLFGGAGSADEREQRLAPYLTEDADVFVVDQMVVPPVLGDVT